MVEDTIEVGDIKTSLRLQPESYDLWNRLAKHMGLKKVQVFNLALRELARREAVPLETERGKEGAA